MRNLSIASCRYTTSSTMMTRGGMRGRCRHIRARNRSSSSRSWGHHLPLPPPAYPASHLHQSYHHMCHTCTPTPPPPHYNMLHARHCNNVSIIEGVITLEYNKSKYMNNHVRSALHKRKRKSKDKKGRNYPKIKA